ALRNIEQRTTNIEQRRRNSGTGEQQGSGGSGGAAERSSAQKLQVANWKLPSKGGVRAQRAGHTEQRPLNIEP
ncbi:MAG: hypothetical protein N3I86_14930, partial [Verrucomicrobiae bacterium]|nr:hypothetical protein [Verrucomicrobiae bacterium]